MRTIFLLLTAAFSLCLCVGTVKAEKRVALVIGNSAYQNVPRLANPANDAAAIGAMLRKVGFDVVETRPDVGIVEMRRTMRDFSDKSVGADISVVYFAGHGMEVEGVNYLIPVDAVLERDRDAFDEAMQLDRVLQAVEPAKKLRLVILDACRDNPFQRTMRRGVASRSLGRGLATVEPTRPNTLIAFAAKGGSTADDGNGAHSPFAAALLKHLATPGLDLRKAFGFVRDDVMNATGNRQEPFVYGSLGGEDVSLVPAAVPYQAASPNGTGPVDLDLAIRRNYELAERIGTTEAWNYFLVSYPAGFYADLARAQRNKLMAGEKRSVSTPDSIPTVEIAKAPPPSAQGEKPIGQVAALPPPESGQAAPAVDQSAAADVARLLQTELRRIGCNAGAVDGNWNAASQKSLQLFNRYAGSKFDVKIASLDALQAVKSKTARVCPLICNTGYKADGDRCIRINCKAGFEMGDNNKCERIVTRNKQDPTATPKKQEQSRGSRCTSIQARCAVAIGGRCEPDTGKWYYGRNGAGGSVMAHNECLSRELRAGRH